MIGVIRWLLRTVSRIVDHDAGREAERARRHHGLGGRGMS